MKTAPTIATALKENYAVRTVPELTVDWNMNRYIGAVADNTPIEDDDGYDVELFPIESIIEPIRPGKGINKARVGMSIVGDDYVWTEPRNGRYYVASKDDLYKYWTSPVISNGTGTLTNCKPYVLYDDNVFVNKIVIQTENSWASAENFQIQILPAQTPDDPFLPDTETWTTIATQTISNSWKPSGRIVLYYTGSSWTTSRYDGSGNFNASPTGINIRAVRMIVTSLEGGYKETTNGSLVTSDYRFDDSITLLNTNGNNSYFDLIEISARLEIDLSNYVVDTSDTFDLSEASQIHPIGTITSNVGSVTLSNLYLDGPDWVPGLFREDNTDSPYHNYIDKNAEMNLRYHYYAEDNTTDALDAYLGVVQQFKMYAENWTGQETDAVTVELSDHSKFFNENNPQPLMWEGLKFSEIVWRLMDSVGFTNYHIDLDADVQTDFEIPVFWVTGEETIWEVLDQLAQASQSAIYFDGNGVLQVKTRDFAFDPTATPVWTFNSVSNAGTGILSDIETMEQTVQFEPNIYKVSYQKTNWQTIGGALPKVERVWEPEGTVALRSTPMVRDLTSGNYFYIGTDDVKLWPYEGIVNIEGELIKYKGKRYTYYDAAGVAQTADITNADEHNTKNRQTPQNKKHLNHYTGGLKIVERGLWNSEQKNHVVDATGYSCRRYIVSSGFSGAWNNSRGFRHMKQDSKVQLKTDNHFNQLNDLLVATRGTGDISEFYHRYGTRLRLVKEEGNTHQSAGITFHNGALGGNEDGYYVEITSRVDNKDRTTRNEVMLYTRTAGKFKSLVGNGRAAPIADNIWYELDVSFRTVSGNHEIRVNVNGKEAFTATVAGGDKATPQSRFGIFARGKTTAEFEYLYATRRDDEVATSLPEDFSFLDRVQRGYTGNWLDREVVWGWVTGYKIKKKKRVKRTKPLERRIAVFDEFGPYVHEAREFDVKFDPMPVQSSRLFFTNDWSAIALEYRSNAFGAHFIMANTSRLTAILNGEDTISGGGQSAINQVLTVLGRTLVVGEAEIEKAENADQIRRRGKNESELTNQWIQSKGMARDLADWLNEHWSYGNDNFTMTIFGNPLIEVGDVVTVNYPEKHINDAFFVTGTQNDFENGLTTILTLRRRV